MATMTSQRAKQVQFALMAVFFTQGILGTAMIPRVPDLIERLDVSFAAWGTILGLAGLGSLLGLSVSNRIITRFGSRNVIRVTSVILSLMLISYAWTENPIVFFALFFVNNFAGGFFNIAVNAQTVVLQKIMNKPIIGRFHASWSVGATITAAVSGLLAATTELWVHFLILGGVALISYLFFGRLILGEHEDEKHTSAKHGKKIPFFKSPPQVWLLAAGLFAGVFAEVALIDWSAILARDGFWLGPAIASIPYTVFAGAMIVGRLSIDRLTRVYHISTLAYWGGIIGGSSLLLGVFAAANIGQTNPYLAMLTASFFFAIAGLGTAPMVPSFFSGAGHVRGLTTAQTMARMSLVSQVTMLLAKIGMGAAVEAATIVFAFIIPAGMLITAGILAGFVVRNSKRSEAVANAFPPTGPITTISD